jgi:hypothetical protein
MKDINQPSPLRLLSVWLLCVLGSLSSWYGVIRLGVWIFSEVCMWSFALLGGCIILIALLAAYVPTIYIRKTNKILTALEQIAANTQQSREHIPAPRQARTA